MDNTISTAVSYVVYNCLADSVEYSINGSMHYSVRAAARRPVRNTVNWSVGISIEQSASDYFKQNE